MDRRRFLLTSLATVVDGPRVANAQGPRRIAFLCPGSCSNLPSVYFSGDQAFMKGLERAGAPGDANVHFDMAGAGIGYQRLPEMATELVRRKANVLVAFGNAAARAARRATSTVPVVMVGVADPVENGLIASLGRPGGNLTGLAVPHEQLVAKNIELLKELNPALSHVAIFWNPELEVPAPRRERIAAAVQRLTVQFEVVEVQTLQDLDKVFATPAVARAGALILPEYSVLLRKEIALFALKRRLPTAGGDRFFVQGGGFMSYGPDVVALYERAGTYTGKLLRGLKTQDMPVEEPSRYELVISKITAAALGLTIPPSLLARADQVIE